MPNGPRLTKDQERARRAYGQVSRVWEDYKRLPQGDAKRKAKKDCDDYEIAVKALGANILRSGLAAALAELMRRKAIKVLEHLADSAIPGLGAETEGRNLLMKANNLPVGTYMLATRETLQVVMWLKRAAEALFDFTPEPGASGSAVSEGDRHAQ